MRKLAAACALAALLLAGAPATAAPPAAPRTVPAISWGAADDTSKYAADGGAWFYGELHGAGLTQNRWTLAWDPHDPTAIRDLPSLERAAPVAQAAGVKITLSLYSATASAHDSGVFCAWAAQVAKTVQAWGIHDYVVWNEPNTRRYWSPQKDASGRDIAAPAYEQLLATCYDALHAADPQANVIGFGLSPRASTSASNEPLIFLRDAGKAYRASGRTMPIMDQLSIHPYPNPGRPTDSPHVGYQAANRFGAPNLDRVKQAVYDAFDGTGQPTTVGPGPRRSAGVEGPLTFVVDEIGWQTDTSAYPQYAGVENVATVSEATQAQYLQTTARRYLACDPTVTSVELFLLVDEQSRDGRDVSGAVVGGGWQSGLLTAGGEGVSQPKAAYLQLAAAFRAGRAACTGRMISWKPATPALAATRAPKKPSTLATCADVRRRTKSKQCRTSSSPFSPTPTFPGAAGGFPSAA